MKPIRVGVVPLSVIFSLVILTGGNARGQEKSVALDSYDFEQLDSATVLITYKFSDQPDREFVATVFLEKKMGHEKIELKGVRGDLRGRISGKTCRITWNTFEDFPGGAVPDDYDLVVRVDRVSEEGWPWYYYAGAGAALAGGIVIYAVSNKDDTPPPPPQAGVIPKPPDRP